MTDKPEDSGLKNAFNDGPGSGAALVAAIRSRFELFGGVELELPPRALGREPPVF
jgi:hypothetical protein